MLRIYGRLIADGDDLLFWAAQRLDHRDPQLVDQCAIIPTRCVVAFAEHNDGQLDFIDIMPAEARSLGLLPRSCLGRRDRRRCLKDERTIDALCCR